MARKVPFRRWLAFNKEAAHSFFEDADVPLHWRLMWLAVAEGNRIGHAEFRRGDLAAVLDVRPDNLNRAIRKAVDLRLLDPLSDSRCLVLPDCWHQGVGDSRCWHHNYNTPTGPAKRQPRRRVQDASPAVVVSPDDRPAPKFDVSDADIAALQSDLAAIPF